MAPRRQQCGGSTFPMRRGGFNRRRGLDLTRFGIPGAPPPFYSQLGSGRRRRRRKGQRGGIAPVLLAAVPLIAKAVAGGVAAGGASFGVEKFLSKVTKKFSRRRKKK